MVIHVSRITMNLQREHRAPPDHTDTNQSPQETNHVYPHIHISAQDLGRPLHLYRMRKRPVFRRWISLMRIAKRVIHYSYMLTRNL